jgi:predicted small lipoprotein YifL
MPSQRVVVSGMLAGILALTLLTGCGKRGPLYLPGEENRAESPKPETTEQSEPPPDSSGY